MIIIRVPRHDENAPTNSIAALNVASSGAKVLDITLVGTEGEYPYTLTLKHNLINRHRTTHFQGSDSEWEGLLNSIFIERSASDLHDVEMIVSELEPSKSLTLTVRRNVEGITSRLCLFQLLYEEDQIIDPIEWISIACLESSSLRTRLAEQDSKVIEKDEAIRQLQAQIEEFTKLSQEHENDLLRNFQKLLNSKKAKIRDQQRLLAASTIDEEAVKRIAGQRSTGSTRAESARKRKAQVDSDESDGFEAMGQANDTAAESWAENPEEDSDNTASVSHDESSDEASANDRIVESRILEDDEDGVEDTTKLPTRGLPAQHMAKTKVTDQAMRDDDETASEDDDEL